jgi:hypothetical protein
MVNLDVIGIGLAGRLSVKYLSCKTHHDDYRLMYEIPMRITEGGTIDRY